MQEFGNKIGWARGGLIVSAVLLAVMGVLCFVAHGIMPEALHTPVLPEGYTWPVGEIIGAVVMLVVGVCQIAAYRMAGGSRNLSGWLIINGVMSIVCCVAALVDPFLGTFSFEWVVAVFIAFVGIASFLGSVAGGRVIGYSGWAIEMLLGLVLIGLAVAILFNSAWAITVAGIAFFVYAVITIMVPFMGNSIKIPAAAA